jgi:P pilus assembly chaperone PapD
LDLNQLSKMAKVALICTVLVACVATTVFGKVIITRADVETNKDYVTSSIVVKNKTDGTFVDVTVDMHRSIDGKVQVSVCRFCSITAIQCLHSPVEHGNV